MPLGHVSVENLYRFEGTIWHVDEVAPTLIERL